MCLRSYTAECAPTVDAHLTAAATCGTEPTSCSERLRCLFLVYNWRVRCQYGSQSLVRRPPSSIPTRTRCRGSPQASCAAPDSSAGSSSAALMADTPIAAECSKSPFGCPSCCSASALLSAGLLPCAESLCWPAAAAYCQVCNRPSSPPVMADKLTICRQLSGAPHAACRRQSNREVRT